VVHVHDRAVADVLPDEQRAMASEWGIRGDLHFLQIGLNPIVQDCFELVSGESDRLELTLASQETHEDELLGVAQSSLAARAVLSSLAGILGTGTVEQTDDGFPPLNAEAVAPDPQIDLVATLDHLAEDLGGTSVELVPDCFCHRNHPQCVGVGVLAQGGSADSPRQLSDNSGSTWHVSSGG